MSVERLVQKFADASNGCLDSLNRGIARKIGKSEAWVQAAEFNLSTVLAVISLASIFFGSWRQVIGWGVLAGFLHQANDGYLRGQLHYPSPQEIESSFTYLHLTEWQVRIPIWRKFPPG